MKKALTFLHLLIALISITNAQNYLIESFQLSATGKNYGIYADIDIGVALCLFFDMQAPNNEQEVQLRMPFTKSGNDHGEVYGEKIDSFFKCLNNAKWKYIEWKNKAQSNKLKQISKKIPVRIKGTAIELCQAALPRPAGGQS